MRYKTFVELCDVPTDILDFLNVKFELAKKQSMPYFVVERKYTQWHMHKEKTKWEDPTDTIWVDPDFELISDFFSSYFNSIFRFRFSLLQAPYILDWHTPHRFPRIHIPLNESDSIFELKETEDSKVMAFPLHYGKAYLIDVTIPHRVVSKTTPFRKNAFFSFKEFATEELNQTYQQENQ